MYSSALIGLKKAPGIQALKHAPASTSPRPPQRLNPPSTLHDLHVGKWHKQGVGHDVLPLTKWKSCKAKALRHKSEPQFCAMGHRGAAGKLLGARKSVGQGVDTWGFWHRQATSLKVGTDKVRATIRVVGCWGQGRLWCSSACSKETHIASALL